MGQYIVFKPTHITQVKAAVKAHMLTTKFGTWKNWVDHKDNREDFEFIRILNKDGKQRWVLPIAVRNNPKFKKLKEICDGITGIKIVELTENDFPIYELDKPVNYE